MKQLKYWILLFVLFMISCHKNSASKLDLPEKEAASKKENNEKNKENSPDKKLENKTSSKDVEIDANKKNESLNLNANNDKESTLRIPATIKPDNKSSIGFQINGVIKKIDVQPGAMVKKDQILAEVEDTQAKLDEQQAQSEFEIAQLSLALQNKKFQWAEERFKKGIISQGGLDVEKNNLQKYQFDFDKAKISLESKKYSFSLTKLRAPYDGAISQLYKSLGDFVAPGQNVFDVVQLNQFSIYAQIPVSLYSRFKVGMKFVISDPLTKDRGMIIIKRVVQIFDTRSRTFDVYGQLESFTKKLLPGDYVEILLGAVYP